MLVRYPYLSLVETAHRARIALLVLVYKYDSNMFRISLSLSLSRDRRGRVGAMSHSINRLFPFLTIHRVGVEVVSCQACPVDYVFQPCGTGSSSSPLAIHRPLQDSRRKVAALFVCP